MSNNGYITLQDNKMQYGPFPKKQLDFMQKAQHINEIEKRPFCLIDFPELGRDKVKSARNFRQYIHKLREYLEVEIEGNPKFYKIRGMILPSSKKVTPRVIGDNMLPILENLRFQPPSIHDIKMRFDTDEGLYNFLCNTGAKANKSNKGIMIELPIDYSVCVIIQVYPKSVHIDIGCTSKPIVYDMSGVIKLAEILGRISGFLRCKTFSYIKIPPANEWVCTSYHFGIDGRDRYDGHAFHRTWQDVAGGFMRVYSKLDKDEKQHVRIEKSVSSGEPFEKQAERMIQRGIMNYN